MKTYGVDLTNGVTIYVENWHMVVAFVNTLRQHVLMIIVCASGEILFDAPTGWDVVTDAPPRT